MGRHGGDCGCIRCCNLSSARAARKARRARDKIISQIIKVLKDNTNADVVSFCLDDGKLLSLPKSGACTLDLTKLPQNAGKAWVTWHDTEDSVEEQATGILYELNKLGSR